MKLISLLVCFGFIVLLFVIDSRKKNRVSVALWVPLIWMMLLYSRSISGWLTVGFSVELESSTALTEGNSLDRNIFLIFIIIGLFILSKRKIAWSKIVQHNGWFIWLYYYCIISLLWSDLPFTSFRKLIKDLSNIIMVLIVLTDSDPLEALRLIIRRCMYVLIPLSIVLIKFFPEYGRYWSPFGGEALNIGVTVGKNGLGVLCSIGGLFFLWDSIIIWRNKKIYFDKTIFTINILFLIMISYLFILANSKTSLGSLIIGVSIISSLSFIRKKVKFVGFFFFHIVLVVIVALSTDLLNIVIESMGRDTTFTGRTDLWEYLIQMDVNPLIGTGYQNFWTGERLEKIWAEYWWHPRQAHSGYLETYLNLGIIGLLSLIAVIISTYKNNTRELVTNFEIGIFQMAILFMIIIYNYTEASFIISTPFWFLFLLTVIKIPQIVIKSDQYYFNL